MAVNKKIGNFGEQVAADYLAAKGLKIIKRNFYCRAGELDIIAADGDCTVFVEVKTRKTDKFGRASEYVDRRKQEKLIKTALYYLGDFDRAMRFDVVEVYYHTNGEEKIADSINHIENAFC